MPLSGRCEHPRAERLGYKSLDVTRARSKVGVPQGEWASGLIHKKAQQQPQFVLHHAVGEFAIRRDRKCVYLRHLSEIDVPHRLIGKPDVSYFKVSAIPEVGRDPETPYIDHAHGAEH